MQTACNVKLHDRQFKTRPNKYVVDAIRTVVTTGQENGPCPGGEGADLWDVARLPFFTRCFSFFTAVIKTILEEEKFI